MRVHLREREREIIERYIWVMVKKKKIIVESGYGYGISGLLRSIAREKRIGITREITFPSSSFLSIYEVS